MRKKSKPFLNRKVQTFFYFLLLILPIFILSLPLLASGALLPAGDFDMQVQMTEAARISIKVYGQFPFLNPWVSGGVPLYADPQFGLITPQTFFSLFFNSVYAWKITIFTYLIVGFFGMLKLLKFISNNHVSSYLLSYIWIMGSFFQLRAIGGHFTFLILALLPLSLYLVLNINKKYYALWLGLLFAYIINASLHYSAIMILIITVSTFILLALVSIINTKIYSPKMFSISVKKQVRYLLKLLLALGFAVLANIYRIYLSLEYARDSISDRSVTYENYIGFYNGIKTLTIPYQSLFYKPDILPYGTLEASNYIGLFTLIIFAILIPLSIFIYYKKYSTLAKPLSYTAKIALVFFIIGIASFAIGLGGPAYDLIRELPVMSSTRVSTRWLFITAFSIIVLIAYLLPRIATYNKIVYKLMVIIIFLSTLQIAYFNYQLSINSWSKNNRLYNVNGDAQALNFSQEKYWKTNETINYFALYEATRNNIGQVVADNALIDTRIKETEICDDDELNCDFVLTDNAVVKYWSPNKIVLLRNKPGVVIINANNSAHWMVNGSYNDLRSPVVQTNPLSINDESEVIILRYFPWPRVLK